MDRAARADERAALRARLLEARLAIPQEERRARDGRIAAGLRGLAAYDDARTVMFYVAVRGEVATETLIRECLARGARVAVPHCAGDGSIAAVSIRDFDRDLTPGRWGIPAPPDRGDAVVEAGRIDLFVVPGIGFDTTGTRLGRGRGCYDLFLAGASPRAPRVALAYEVQIVRRLEQEPHDVPMDWIVTEDRIIDCAKIREGARRAREAGPRDS
ncbi:MAG: 5-formyltetrahydrofolate cyclo-ligase [bacterium]|nr:5-formyltetrahydrofolate cyclo-ligase [bacterium]